METNNHCWMAKINPLCMTPEPKLTKNLNPEHSNEEMDIPEDNQVYEFVQ